MEHDASVEPYDTILPPRSRGNSHSRDYHLGKLYADVRAKNGAVRQPRLALNLRYYSMEAYFGSVWYLLTIMSGDQWQSRLSTDGY